MLLILSLVHLLISSAPASYTTLDNNDPIEFHGSFIIYGGDTIHLGPKAFFIDGQLGDEVVKELDYVFNSINEASQHLSPGSEESPMTLHIAPYVYWIDNPDDPEIRVPQEGEAVPYGLIIECEWLRFRGLTKNAENVVLAGNRGQTIGSKGNFTLFKFVGDGTSAENVTFGNYCNVDLHFPLKPSLNREKRASAFVQAQLIHCNGDKIVARNTRFISRLNLCPFVGGKRVLFDQCHFELTDDALCGTGVYLNSTFDFYSSKPFYWTRGTGAVFLNCDIYSRVIGTQFFTKAGGQLAVVDTRFHSTSIQPIAWQDNEHLSSRNYQYNVSLNGSPITIGGEGSPTTVKMEDKIMKDAYKIFLNGQTVYNTYNLLRGDDDWDPMHIKDLLYMAEEESGSNYSLIPIMMEMNVTEAVLETGKEELLLSPSLYRFGNYLHEKSPVTWSVATEHESFVRLIVNDEGTECRVIPTNETNKTEQVVVNATSSHGLEAAVVLNVAPSMLPAPVLTTSPVIAYEETGILRLDYELLSGYEDQSLITWYRCQKEGEHPIKVAVSRFNVPLTTYVLTSADVGHYIMATIEPKHERSYPGNPVRSITPSPVSHEEVKTDPLDLHTDFLNSPTEHQPLVLPGFWTLNNFDPGFQHRNERLPSSEHTWNYGEGVDGAHGLWGLIPSGYVQLAYTPVEKEYTDMQLHMEEPQPYLKR